MCFLGLQGCNVREACSENICSSHVVNKLFNFQETVESEPHFDAVFKNFLTWVEVTHNKVGKEDNFIFVTCGDWDLKVMLPEQCQLLTISIPGCMKKWINIKKVSSSYLCCLYKGQ